MSYWDQLALGQPEILGSHRFDAEAIIAFARKYDPQPFHTDAEAAKSSLFGGLCASGWHTAAVCMRLNVESRARHIREWVEAGHPPPRLGPSPGVKNVRWLKPVFAGDTVTYTQTITAKRPSDSRPGWGVIETATVGVNQNGETVFSFDAAAFAGTD